MAAWSRSTEIGIAAASRATSCCRSSRTPRPQPGTWQIVTYRTPEANRRVSDREVAWLERLRDKGVVESAFNWAFFTSGDSREPELAGIRGALVGSALTLLVTLISACRSASPAAIYLEEFAPKNRLTEIIEVNINNLAAVPSIVFGLLGLAIFLNFFGLPRSAPLVGGLVLALLVLPTIIIASRAALKAVPPSIKEAALGVGASHQQAIFHHVLPLAMPGIMTGTIIGMAHALGETAPLLMIGMVAFIVEVPERRHRCGDRAAGSDLSVVGPAGDRLPGQDGGRDHRAAGVPVRHEWRGDLAAQAVRAPLVSERYGDVSDGCHGAIEPPGAPRAQPRTRGRRSSRATSTSIYGDKHALQERRSSTFRNARSRPSSARRAAASRPSCAASTA